MLALVGCHHGPPTPAATPNVTTTDRVWMLEASGAAVSDTSVTFPAAAGRTVVLRHGKPDDALFLIIDFPAAKDSLHRGDSIHVRIQPVPGKYAFSINGRDSLPAGTQATFSYAIHFVTPADAATRFSIPGRFEMALEPAFIAGENSVRFLVGSRPGADMIRFPLATAGSYGLVAPK